MTINEFKANNEITNEIELKDGRILLATKNGFEYYVVSKKGIVNKVDEQYYNKAKINRISKRHRRNSK